MSRYVRALLAVLVALSATGALAGVEASFTATSGTTTAFSASGHFYRDTVLSDGPSAYWRLGDGGGVTAADAVGSADGHVGPVKGVPGPLGVGDTAARFSGDQQSVVVADSAALRPAGPLTLEAWVRPATGITDWSMALGKTSTSNWPDGYGLYWHQGRMHAFVGAWDQRDVSAAVPLDTWSHVVATFDGSTSFQLYVDGLPTDSSASAAAATMSASPLGLGSVFWDSFYWKGDLADVAVYDSALSPAQVLDHAGQTTSYAAHVLADHPVALWRLGEGDPAATAADATGAHDGRYGLLGTGSGLTSDTDGAAAFDGKGDSVVVPDRPALSPASAITVEAWVKPATGTVDWASAVSKATDDTWPDGYGIYWKNDAGGRIGFYVGGNQTRTTAPLPLDTWSHVVGTYDGATVRLYVDGVEAASTPFVGASPVTPAPLFIGAGAERPGYATYPWLGSVDEVAVYDSALSAAQIARHYARGL